MSNAPSILLAHLALQTLLATISPSTAAQPAQSAVQLRRSLPPEAPVGLQPAAPADEAPSPWRWRVGVAHSRAGAATSTVSTPFAVQHAWADGTWLEASGGGYARSSTAGAANASGIADFALAIHRAVTPETIGTLAVNVPTAGEVGSSSASQRGALLHQNGIGQRWTAAIYVEATRLNVRAPNESRFGSGLSLSATHRFDSGRALGTRWTRAYRRGAGGTTDVGVEGEWPLASRWAAWLSVGRGLTSGARHTTAEIDLAYNY